MGEKGNVASVAESAGTAGGGIGAAARDIGGSALGVVSGVATGVATGVGTHQVQDRITGEPEEPEEEEPTGASPR